MRLLGIWLLFMLAGCGQGTRPRGETLKESYKEYFPIGIGMHYGDQSGDTGRMIAKHFSSVTTARAFKFEFIHPHQDTYNWQEADSIVHFASVNGLLIRGHTLVWGNRNPYWLFWDSTGKLVNRHLLSGRLKDHIQTIMSRYKDEVKVWDVVNEALYDNNKEFYAHNTWYKTMGDDYIAESFLVTRSADTTARLFYNDYDIEEKGKKGRVIRMVKEMRERGVRIDGIGIQAHWTADRPGLGEIEDAILAFGELGMDVHITELDIVHHKGIENGAAEQVPEAVKKRYEEVFKIFRRHRNIVRSVTFWQSGNKAHVFSPLFNDRLQSTDLYRRLLDF